MEVLTTLFYAFGAYVFFAMISKSAWEKVKAERIEDGSDGLENSMVSVGVDVLTLIPSYLWYLVGVLSSLYWLFISVAIFLLLLLQVDKLKPYANMIFGLLSFGISAYYFHYI